MRRERGEREVDEEEKERTGVLTMVENAANKGNTQK